MLQTLTILHVSLFHWIINLIRENLSCHYHHLLHLSKWISGNRTPAELRKTIRYMITPQLFPVAIFIRSKAVSMTSENKKSLRKVSSCKKLDHLSRWKYDPWCKHFVFVANSCLQWTQEVNLRGYNLRGRHFRAKWVEGESFVERE